MTGGLIRRRRFLFVLLALAGCLLLAGLGWWIGREAGRTEPIARPALWHLARDGREAYVFGTLHAVPQGARWLGPPVRQAIGRSDRLVLEVTGLETEHRTRATFLRLARAPGLPPVSARLDPAEAALLAPLIARDPEGLGDLDHYRSWGAALLINASAASGLALSTDAAPERQLSRAFAADGKPVSGLETIEGQLGLFDKLSEADQRQLLAQSVREAGAARTQYGQLYAAWSRGDLARLEQQFLAPLSAAPALRAALLVDRNARWADLLDRQLADMPGIAFVAVGSGHLVGPGNLLADLAARGWQVGRLQ